jgi:CRP/FNR family transcriptional regulator, cyclic AMP receptor protein
MFAKSTKINTLKEVPFFSGLSKKELEIVAKGSDELTLAAGTVIVEQGQIGREAFLILSGTVSVKRNGRKVATMGAGNLVGELSLLDHGPRTATVTCDTECTFLVVDQRHFLGIVLASPSLTTKILATLASRVREFDKSTYG